MNPRIALPLLAAAATGVQVGANIVATRFVIDQTAPAVLLTIAGVGFALGDRAAAGAAWIGDAAVFASALVGAICSVLYRPYLQRYPALPVSAFAMLASVLFLAVLAAGEGFFAHGP